MVKLNEQKRMTYAKQIYDLLKSGDVEQFREWFLALHPTDQADIFIELAIEARQKVYQFLSPNEFAEVFEGLEKKEQMYVFKELDPTYGSAMLNDMYADDVVTFLSFLSEREVTAILNSMEVEEANEVRELLSYEPETAGAIMTKEFIRVSAVETVAEVIGRLRKEAPDAETIYYLYVVDEREKLVGVVSLRDLITSEETDLVQDVMSREVVSVSAKTDQEDVARLIKKYDFLAAPVISNEGKLVGIVTVDDIIDILEEEATEDLGEFSASKGATDVDVSSFQAAKKRAPWIILLMFFGLITAEVIGQFEETLEAIVLLAAFIPLLMDSAGNTGTQSLAVAVRGLALGTVERDGVWKMLKRELGTGLMLGFICMLVIAGIVTVMHGNMMLAFIVGISIFLTLSIATIIGTIVPLIINKMKLDPAIASGPFITTVNDILGLLIYFSIATALLEYL
ncbi:magnesium transporter [Alkalihalophilus marmarensis]|uniref:magnesium transporter n=1 Tax=Alkalihalophilus marmarensis TaxID=521377 RepID=UPI002E20DF5D|nr:magnesium transporter [Alkalihalophilus marmarensis]MED1600907.1 magnesium transporter [Alkalihalophilus marmarensis]